MIVKIKSLVAVERSLHRVERFDQEADKTTIIGNRFEWLMQARCNQAFC